MSIAGVTSGRQYESDPDGSPNFFVIKEVSDDVWLVTFMHCDLGFFDNETDRITRVDNPFAARVPMSPE